VSRKLTERELRLIEKRQSMPLVARCLHVNAEGKQCHTTIAPRFTGHDVCSYHSGERRRHREAAA
jgi:hypothetical protein